MRVQRNVFHTRKRNEHDHDEHDHNEDAPLPKAKKGERQKATRALIEELKRDVAALRKEVDAYFRK